MHSRNIGISVKDFDAALEAIKSLGTWGSESSTLKDAFLEWSWEPYFDEFGNITALSFHGEALNQELFEAISKYIRKGTYIEIHDNESPITRWMFDGENMIVVKPKILFENTIPDPFSMERYRSMANYIINEFEDLLKQHSIVIPDELRDGNTETEGPIYGRTYCDLEVEISNYLKEQFEKNIKSSD